jgi:glyoxylase-like metal-dependent hydrolase (beta-lactamase superfamily II)
LAVLLNHDPTRQVGAPDASLLAGGELMQSYGVRGSADEGRQLEFADDILRVPTGIVNTYLVGTAEQWFLVDTGITGCAPVIRGAAAARFGADSRPVAIVLTHGHFDHAGNADTLALDWDVPVLAHPLEMPYLTGRSDYPPIDSTMGGAIATMARAFPRSGRTLRAQLFELSGGTIPGVPDWRWIHTPGHTPGHVSLFRESDRALLAGDALVTMNMDSWAEQVRRTPEPANPPAPLTTDWVSARRSVEDLALLRPRGVAAGHGLPIAGEGIADALQVFARTFTPPQGRYAIAPAQAGREGVEWVPPPVPDAFPRQVAGAAFVAIGILGLAAAARRR